MKLVVGLGNPGSEYVGTRHNIGFDVIDSLAAKLGSSGEFNRVAKTKFDALAMELPYMKLDGQPEKILLLKPMTYMNASGRSVQSAMAFYQLSPADIMVVLDDLALPCGKIRLRAGGSSGGHNGLRDIERAIATSEYPRLRMGIDPAPPQIRGKDYVLGRFSPEQRELMKAAIVKATNAVTIWIDKGITLAMTQFNADEKKEEPK
jgi:PTH1 family peptidyl-tRNA hydrolase